LSLVVCIFKYLRFHVCYQFIYYNHCKAPQNVDFYGAYIINIVLLLFRHCFGMAKHVNKHKVVSTYSYTVEKDAMFTSRWCSRGARTS